MVNIEGCMLVWLVWFVCLLVCLWACNVCFFVCWRCALDCSRACQFDDQWCLRAAISSLYIIKWRVTAQNPILRYGTRSHDDYMSPERKQIDPSEIGWKQPKTTSHQPGGKRPRDCLDRGFPPVSLLKQGEKTNVCWISVHLELDAKMSMTHLYNQHLAILCDLFGMLK